MKRFLRPFCIVLVCILLLPMLVSCGASRPVRASFRAGRVVAKAGEVEILYEELYYITMNYIKELEKTYGEGALESEAVRAELESLVWGNLLSEETALMSLGYKYGLNVYKGDIADSVSADIAQIITDGYEGDRKAYIADLEAMYMTEHYARKSFGVNDYLKSEILFACAKGLSVTEATVRADVEAGKFVCVRQVLVTNKTGDAAGDAAALATAERIRATLLAATDTTARCKAMNEAIRSTDNKDFGDTLGYGYYFPRGYMSEAYEAIAFSLEEYGVGEVLKAEDGYYVIMRMPIDKTYVEQNLYDLQSMYYRLEYNRLVTAEHAALTLEKTRFGEGLDLTALPAIDMNGGTVAITVALVALGVLLGGGAFAIIWRSFRRKKSGK